MSSGKIVRIWLTERYMTITELSKRMTAETGRKYTRQSLSKKISRNSLKYSEMEIIAKILNYKIEFIDLENK